MITNSIAFIFCIMVFGTIAQIDKKIDQIDGIGNYKFGSTQLECGCTEDKMIRDGWDMCILKPKNLYIGGYKALKATLAWKRKGFDLNFIRLDLGIQDFQEILGKLKSKYGTPTETREEDIFTYKKYIWRGNNVEISLSKGKENNDVFIIYEHLGARIEVGF